MSAALEVAELRERLGAAEQAVVAALQAAQESADRLIQAPSVELVPARDLAKAEAEVASLEVERLRRELEQAREIERQDAIGELLTSQGPIQQRASEADDAVWGSLAAHEQALEAQLACRLELRRLNGRLHQLGYTGEALQLCVRPRQPEYNRRVAALQGQYAKISHPLSAMPPLMRGQGDGTNG
jgi:hypothetical protein